MRRVSTVLGLVLALLAASCAGPTAHLPGRIAGPSGATVELPGGVSLQIPAGALDSEIELGVEIVEDLAAAGYAAPPSFLDGAPVSAVALTPHGTAFETPVTLTLPFEGPADELVVLRLDDEKDTRWEPVGPIAFADGRATLSISTFSLALLARVRVGACPCFSGSDVATFLRVGEELSAGWRASSEFWMNKVLTDEPGTGLPPGSLVSMGSQFFEEISRPSRSAGMAAWFAEAMDASAPPMSACEMRAIDSSEGSWARWFPGLEYTRDSLPYYRGRRFLDIDRTAALSCISLLARTTSAAPRFQLAFVSSGLPPEESVRVGVVGEPGFVELAADRTLAWSFAALASGSSFAVEVRQQPATAVCSLSPASGTVTANQLVAVTCGPASTCPDADGDGVTTCGADGIPGNEDDDCDDGRRETRPGASELCDGRDNDCDGAFSPGETADADGDGLFDFCDPQPETGCPCFDVARVRELASGGVCYQSDRTLEPGLEKTGVTRWLAADQELVAEVFRGIANPADTGCQYACFGRGCAEGAIGLGLATELEIAACEAVATAGCR